MHRQQKKAKDFLVKVTFLLTTNSGNTGTRPRQDTTNPSRTGAPSDPIDGDGKGSDEGGSQT